MLEVLARCVRAWGQDRSRRRARSWRPAVEDLEGRCLLAVNWVYPGSDGFLHYGKDAHGNRVPDFSEVGYGSGIVPLPYTTGGVNVPTRVTLSPTSGDQTARIQAAIDQVSQLPPDASGYRGAVYLRAGNYPIGGQLHIRTSGVVLRGASRSATTGTNLEATGTSQRTLIVVSGSGSPQKVSGTEHQMTDTYVPVGATSFHVDSTAGLHVGDTVIVHRPSTANWIHAIGMDRLQYPWQPGSKDLNFDRVITRISGTTVYVDAPLTNSFEQQYGGGTIYKYAWPGRLTNVGIYNLRGYSDHVSSTDENHSWTFIGLDAVENAWVRSITGQYFAYAAVQVGSGAKWVTVDNAQCLDPISQITGERRYSFDVNGQLTLVENSYARKGRHDFVLGATVPGPNAFVNDKSDTAYNESGPHQRWATGTLFDNVTVNGNRLQARNAGNEGTGHGWNGANMVFWNSTAQTFLVENPPTAQNWALGDQAGGGHSGNGYYQSWGQPLTPQSLYAAQLQDRLARLGGAPGAPGSDDSGSADDDAPSPALSDAGLAAAQAVPASSPAPVMTPFTLESSSDSLAGIRTAAERQHSPVPNLPVRGGLSSSGIGDPARRGTAGAVDAGRVQEVTDQVFAEEDALLG